MTTLSMLAAQALLLSTVVWSRPANITATRSRLLVQGALLCVCLLGRLADNSAALGPVCVAATLLELGLLRWCAGRWPDPDAPLAGAASIAASGFAPRASSGSAPLARWLAWGPVATCVLLCWLAFRLLPATPMACISLAVVLCGLVGVLVSRDHRTAWWSLLQPRHGVLLFVGAVPGPGWPGLLLALPLQGVALAAICRRPVWSDAPERERP